MASEEERQATKENIATEDTPNYDEQGPRKLVKSTADVEKEQEAKLRSKYPALNKGPGNSAFLQKRLSKGQKYFDSGDYNMAKAKMGPGVKGPGPQGFKVPTVPIGSTGEAIPTPDSVPIRKTSIAHLKHLT